MVELSDADYRKVLLAVEHLASGEDDAGFPARALKAVIVATEADFASYAELDLANGRNRFLVLPTLSEVAGDADSYARFVRRFGNHPIVAHFVVTSEVEHDRDHFVRRLRMMGAVGNCCGEAALVLNLSFDAPTRERRQVGISISRALREFGQHDAAVLAALRPHLAAAHRVAVRLGSPMPIGPDMVGGLPLTVREGQVLYWVAMGKTNEEVSIIVGARPMTVKKHLEHIYDKLGVPNRTAAASFLRTAHGLA